MSTVLNYNCTTLGSHEKVSCGNYKFGGSSVLAIIESDHTVTDWESASDWQSNIVAGKIHLIENVKVTMPEPTPQEGENPRGGQTATILDSFEWTWTFKDFNYNQNNVDFYNALNERTFYVAMLHDEDDEITVNAIHPCTAVVRQMAPEAVTEKRGFMGTIKFAGKDLLPIYTAPAGVFYQG